MTEISGKSLHEIYKEDARKYKESIEKGRVYSESEDILTGNFDKSESLTVTMSMEEFDKLEKLALSAHTDKLSVEKLQEHLLPYKKETVQKIIDEKMQLVTADEFLKLHKEYLTAIRENGKLQEQLNTAKKALKEIAYGEYNTFKLSAVPIAKQALAAIGWGGCPVGAVGKNGLTKEEIEGSGDGQ